MDEYNISKLKDEYNISKLKGKTILSISINEDKDLILLRCSDGTKWLMYHDQSCCEYVAIEDICGDLEDLIGSPLLVAEEVNSDWGPVLHENHEPDSFTWTFYKFDTIKGGVTIRWYGESSGYYSEDVSLAKWNGKSLRFEDIEGRSVFADLDDPLFNNLLTKL